MITRSKAGVPVFVGDIVEEDLFEPAQFDVVTLWGVLEHVPNPQGLIRACTRLLRPRGLILLETPNAQALFRLISQWLIVTTHGRFERSFLETLRAGHVVWYSRKGLLAACGRLGLLVEDVCGSCNSTRFLLQRFRRLAVPKRLVYQVATAASNCTAIPLGFPNQLLAALRLE